MYTGKNPRKNSFGKPRKQKYASAQDPRWLLRSIKVVNLDTCLPVTLLVSSNCSLYQKKKMIGFKNK